MDRPVGAGDQRRRKLAKLRNGDQREVYYRPAFPLIRKTLRVFDVVDTAGDILADRQVVLD